MHFKSIYTLFTVTSVVVTLAACISLKEKQDFFSTWRDSQFFFLKIFHNLFFFFFTKYKRYSLLRFEFCPLHFLF